ncbi:MAG: hypothetical protein AB8B47_15690 [Roseobacter sp.]
MLLFTICSIFAVSLSVGLWLASYFSGVLLLTVTLGLAAVGVLVARYSTTGTDWFSLGSVMLIIGYVVPGTLGFGAGAFIGTMRKG